MSKKPAPPSETPPRPSIDPADAVDVAKTLHLMDRVLQHSLNPAQGITPGQLGDLCQMMLTNMHMRKVTPEFWLDATNDIFDLYELAATVAAEAVLGKVKGLDPDVSKTLAGAMELSLNEITHMRIKLVALHTELMKCPPPGTKIN